MTTDSLDGLEQLRRIIDEQPEPAPESVMLGLDYCYAEWVAERARHAEEVAALRGQFRRLEGLIGSDAVRRINDLEIQLCTVRDQLDDAHIELAARRALDADVMACAERCRDTLIGPPGMPVEDYPLAPEALAARRILAADFLREGGE